MVMDSRGDHGHIGSRTYIKVNRGAITGLSEGKIGKMAEDLILTCDWIKLRGSVSENMAELLSTFLKKKGSPHQVFLEFFEEH